MDDERAGRAVAGIPGRERLRRGPRLVLGCDHGGHGAWADVVGRDGHDADGGGAEVDAREAEGQALTWREAAAYASRARGERTRPHHGWVSLTPTEQRVVALVAEGLTNPEIAKRLLMGRSTVKTHLEHIFTKLDVHSRAELAAKAAARPPVH